RRTPGAAVEMPYESEFHLRSLVLALLAAAATCAVTLLAMGLLHGASVEFDLALWILPLYVAGALLTAVLFALPVLFVMRPMGLVNRWSTMLVGAALGAFNGWMSVRQGSVP